MSEIGDAYQLASAFGGDFGALIATGQTPFGGAARVKPPRLGGRRDADCDAYGSSPGFIGFVAENFGVPPGVTDKGARPANAKAAAR